MVRPFLGRAVCPAMVGRKDSGMKAEGSGNTMPKHMPQRGQRRHAEDPSGNLEVEMKGTNAMNSAHSNCKSQYSLTVQSHLADSYPAAGHCRKLERKHHYLSPPQPPLPQCLNAQFFLPQFLKQEERAKKPYCLLCLFQPLPQVLAAVRSTPLCSLRSRIQLPSQRQWKWAAVTAAVVSMTAMSNSPAEDCVSFIRCPNNFAVSFIKYIYQTTKRSSCLKLCISSAWSSLATVKSHV